MKDAVDSGASISIVHKNVLHKCHKLIKQRKNTLSSMAGTFNITPTTALELKLLELNFAVEIVVKCNLIDNLLNYN